jgi:hypothetical protein
MVFHDYMERVSFLEKSGSLFWLIFKNSTFLKKENLTITIYLVRYVLKKKKKKKREKEKRLIITVIIDFIIKSIMIITDYS